MRQLTASEASNDEMERQRFEKWASTMYDTRLLKFHNGDYKGRVLQQMWECWQAALKSKQGEV